MSEDAWSILLDRLEERVPDFVERFLSELHTRVLYEPELVPLDDLSKTANETMRMLIARLRAEEPVRRDITDALGRRRARQGVPLERLIEAIRLDLRLVWQLLLELAHPDYTEVLVENVERLMTVVDGYVSDVQQAFLRELAILQRDSRLATERHLSRLFNAQDPSPSLLGDIAEGIGVDPDDDFELLMLLEPSEQHRDRRLAGWLAKPQVLAYMFRGRLLLFRPWDSGRTVWPEEFSTTPSVYIAQVDGLRSLPAAARAATELLGLAATPDRLVHLEEFWALGAASALRTLIPGQSEARLGGLSQFPDEERERLLGTVRIFLRSGSVKETAGSAGCHRNTVINRLKLFQHCTGLDLTIPAQAALAYVVLAGENGEFSPVPA